jgi:hypothetical protein
MADLQAGKNNAHPNAAVNPVVSAAGKNPRTWGSSDLSTSLTFVT